MTTPAAHVPVMLREVLDTLSPSDGGVFADATFGAGGYSRAILEAAACRVLGIDRDPDAVERGNALAEQFSGRLEVLNGCYGDMKELLKDSGVDRLDGVAFDLGVSSMQLDQAERGFSFRADGPLDMRMGRDGETAADVVNHLEEKELADIIFRYGEERLSRRIARAIVKTRSTQPFERTSQLADLVRRVMPRAGDRLDPATRTFQALRIHVNDELGEIERGLKAAESLLAPGGRLAVVSFHSLEDRKVKDFLRQRSGGTPRPSRHLPDSASSGQEPSFRLLRRGAIKPSADEVAVNPRARSARLRAAERTAAPPWPDNDPERRAA